MVCKLGHAQLQRQKGWSLRPSGRQEFVFWDEEYPRNLHLQPQQQPNRGLEATGGQKTIQRNSQSSISG